MRIGLRPGATPASVNKYLLPGEHQLICVRRHPEALLGPITLTLVALLAGGLVTGFALLNSTGLEIVWLATAVLFLRMLWKIAYWSGDYFVVTPGRMLLVSGLVNRKLATMPLSAVTDLRMRRSARGRLFGYGNFVAESDLPDQSVGVVDSVPFPNEVYLATWLGPDPRDPIEDLVLAYLQGSCSRVAIQDRPAARAGIRKSASEFTCGGPGTAIPYGRRPAR